MDLNVCMFTGRLGGEPELKRTANGTAVCTVSIAVQRNSKTPQTDWITAIFWKNNAEHLCRYGKKGASVALVTSLEVREYKDKNGNNRKATEFVVKNFKFTGNARDTSFSQDNFNDGNNGYGDNSYPTFTDVDEMDGELPF